MFSQLSEQMKKSSQPASDLFAANVKAMQDVSQQQTSLLTGMLSDSMKMLKDLSAQTEIKDVLAAQSVYAESVRERVTSTSKSTYNTLNDVGQQFTGVVKTSIETAGKAGSVAATPKAVAKIVSDETAAAKEVATKAVAPKAAKKAVAKTSTETVKAPSKAATKKVAAKGSSTKSVKQANVKSSD